MPPITFDLSLLLPVSSTLSAPYGILQFFLIAGFILHILAMNIVVGLTCLFFFQRVFPPKHTIVEQDRVSPLWAFLPKGLALVVNFGVVPLLFIQVVYGYLVYNADIVMGVWWLSVMMVVMLAYYGLYISTSYSNVSSGVRTFTLFITLFLLLCNAFIFVNKATLVQDPASWLNHARNPLGIFLNFDPQLIPRYLHMVVSCLAIGGLALSFYASKRLNSLEKNGAPGNDLRRVATQENTGLQWYFYATALQLIIGLWFLLSLPESQQKIFMGGNKLGTGLFIVGLVFVMLSLLASKQKKMVTTICSLLVVVLSMAGMRHILRLSMLENFPAPADSPLDVGPFLMFAVSVILTIVAIFYMFKLVSASKEHGGQPRTTPQQGDI